MMLSKSVFCAESHQLHGKLAGAVSPLEWATSITCFMTDNHMQTLYDHMSLMAEESNMGHMGLMVDIAVGHGLVMKIGDFGMSRQVIMRQSGDEVCLERALSANVIGTAAYSAPELLLADSPVKKNRVDAATVLKSDVSLCISHGMPSRPNFGPSNCKLRFCRS